MSQSDKLEECKKEIRSILVPYQKGCTLSEFNRSYREFIGRKLAFRDFGYRSDIEFLYSMTDVVRICSTRTGDYLLEAVPDESVMHIQKMVARQKPSKSRAPSRISNFNRYVLPPRFSEPPFKPVSREIRNIRELKFQPKQEPKINFQVSIKQPKLPLQETPKLPPKASPKDEVIALVQHFENKLALDDLLFEYKRMYQKDLLLSKYGYDSLEECLEDFTELHIKYINKCAFVVYQPESQTVLDKNESHSTQNNEDSSEVQSTYSSEKYSQISKDVLIPDSFMKKLKMVAAKFTEIRASEFLSCFEKVTGSSFDLNNLGYRCLSDLIDDVPDIFTRESVVGSRKDYIIYSVNGGRPKPEGTTLVQLVIMNLRKILQAYPEGIEIQDLSHIYSINFSDTLHVPDFGFEDIETFLISIKNQVPLLIDSSEGVKVIHLLHSGSTGIPDLSLSEAVPLDVAHPEFKFEPQIFPDNYDLAKYHPVYTSSVGNPGHLYIQLQGEQTAEVLEKIDVEIQNVYNGKKSNLYMMKNIHIKVGASCVAKWPSDNHWYRAEIISIPSMETVMVHYVDYGTRDTIPKKLLRYIKQEFVNLPAQAIKCRLAFLKPANNAVKWDAKSTTRILNLCKDVSLMAKVEAVEPDGVYSILLCDTNGDEDIYINDLLCNEGLAAYDVVEDEDVRISSPVPSVPPPMVSMECHHNLNPLQALQAQYFLQAFVTVAPSFAQNENYLSLLREVSMFCKSPDPVLPNVGMPQTPYSGPPGFNTLQSGISSFSNSSMLPSVQLSPPTAVVLPEPKLNISVSPINIPNPYVTKTKDYETFTTPKSLEENIVENSEIFDFDDDEIFQQFCQKITSTKMRHVKKITLGDGYRIHVIVVESKPYASSGDISQLIWTNKDADYLFRRLQVQDIDFSTLKLSEEGNEDLFYQLERFNVKGIQKIGGGKASILLYPLKVVIKILNIFGHPSVALRTKLTEEIANFDPNDPDWMTFHSPEPSEAVDEENFSAATDDDKIEKLCLFDLLAMKESITARKRKMLNTLSNTGDKSKKEEIEKLEQLQNRVLQRIKQIKEICSLFVS